MIANITEENLKESGLSDKQIDWVSSILAIHGTARAMDEVNTFIALNRSSKS